MGISARSLQLNTNTMKSGQDTLQVNLNATGDLTSSGSGIAINTTLSQGYTFSVMPQCSATPSAGSELVNVTYVQNQLAGLDWKPDYDLVATTNIAALSGVATTIDGVVATAGKRVLLTAQTTASQNGGYLVAAGAWTRTSDLATTIDPKGAVTVITAGTTYANTVWRQTAGSVVIGTGAMVWSQLPVGSPTAGTGIAVSGFTISQDIAGLTNMAATVAMNDSFALYDLSGTAIVESTVQQLFDGVAVSATALSTGVDKADVFAIYDSSASTTKSATVDNIFYGELTTGTALTSIDVADKVVVYDASGNSVAVSTTKDVIEGVINSATSTSIATGDKIVFADVSNSNVLRSTTVSDIVALASPTIEVITLTGGQVAGRSVTLTSALTTPAKCWLHSRGGAANYHSDGEVTFTAGAAGAATLTWAAGSAGDGSMGGNLIAGDKLYVHYI